MSCKTWGTREFVQPFPLPSQKKGNSFQTSRTTYPWEDKLQVLDTNNAEIRSKEINGGIPTETKQSILAFATSKEDTPSPFFPTKIIWSMVFKLIALHLGALIGLFLALTFAMWKTIFFAIILYVTSGIGITAGYHRLWGHRAYKAKLPLRILLAFLGTMGLQEDIYWWCRDHRVHHKFTETNADPYNAKRGFFFSHIGWLMIRKRPEVYEKIKTVDMSDLLADPVVVFQRKYYKLLATLCCFVLPTAVPNILWGENIIISFFISGALRATALLHITFMVNSFAHMFGNRPYSEHTEARENMLVTFWALGEGFHNFHHTFPWDYAASEFGTHFSISTAFINLMAWCGLAYDLRTAPKDIIRTRKEKLRNGSDHLTKPLESKFN